MSIEMVRRAVERVRSRRMPPDVVRESNPVWRERACRWCSEMFDPRKSGKGKYCSDDCETSQRLVDEQLKKKPAKNNICMGKEKIRKDKTIPSPADLARLGILRTAGCDRLTTREAMALMGERTKNTCIKHLGMLRRFGFLTKSGSNHNRRWTLKK